MSQYRFQNQRRLGPFAVALMSVIVLAGCTTRQVVEPLAGSTAQRLVTYSLDRFIKDLAAQPEIAAMQGSKVRLGVHFMKDHPLMEYSTRLITAQLQLSHNITVAAPGEPVESEIEVFFNSMGTDSDDFGLSVPTFGLTPTSDSINVLALDMYHGITEGYAIIRSADNGSIQITERLLARIRRDNVSTPIIDFPLNQLD